MFGFIFCLQPRKQKMWALLALLDLSPSHANGIRNYGLDYRFEWGEIDRMKSFMDPLDGLEAWVWVFLNGSVSWGSGLQIQPTEASSKLTALNLYLSKCSLAAVAMAFPTKIDFVADHSFLFTIIKNRAATTLLIFPKCSSHRRKISAARLSTSS